VSEEPASRLLELGVPGALRDRLVRAVLSGEKVATSSLRLQYEEAGEALPQAGERLAVIDSSGRAVAQVLLTEVRIIRLGDADIELAREEGEGFASVAQWRAAHEVFWRGEVLPFLRAVVLDQDTEIVVERFRLLGAAPA